LIAIDVLLSRRAYDSPVRAVVLDDAGQPGLGEVPEPSGPGQLVQVLACGLCGSDLEKIGRAPAGTVLGHEVVAQTSSGQRVVLVHHLPCGECERCLAGHESTCARFAAATIVPGGFAERVRAAASLDLPYGLDEALGTLAEPLACVLRGVERLSAGRALVVGCGTIGLLFVQVLRRRGFEVVARDPRRERLERAQALGAQEDGGFYDAAVLCAHEGLNDALRALVPGATLLVFASPADHVAVDVDRIYRNELSVVGSRSATPVHLREALDLLPHLRLPPITRLPLEAFAEGVELYRSGEAMKVVFHP
jgi:L-iditol 2-dehydrogenase